ncbi:MAG TPA: UTP--glucose-1-phosphate uridylyltransferase GalU [Stellaceae bacterium]|nr:UTP--glucose-1-phosphate uridylyltransferase GalU [Stellaceae bacterium]
MAPKVRKAVFPVAGLGTRFLPATKAMPKEMLAVVDKPLIQYAVEEAREAGIEQFIFITSRGKGVIEDHFDRAVELEATLHERDKEAELAELTSWMPKPGEFAFVRQQQPLGLGHAVWCARDLVGQEPFAVLLADDLIQAPQSCLKQMIDAHRRVGGNMIAVMDVPREHTQRYGILDIEQDDKRLVKVRGLVEKPAPDKAPSTLGIIGRYILQPELFRHLSRFERGAGNEIQITDALARLLGGDTPFHGFRFEGTRFDCGDKAGFLAATVAFALARPELADSMRRIIHNLR